jgi:predicted transcriptional regulator
MAPKKTMAVRVDEATEARLEDLAELMSKRAQGAEVTKSNVLRVALDRGLEALERDLGVKRSKQQK